MTTFIAPAKRELMLDVREERSLASPLELRENKATGEVVVRGYAATFEPYDCYGGPEAGGWVEQLSPRSLDKTLAAGPDVMLLLNHGGAPLARTAHGGHPGTMTLTGDRRGLLVEARLDPTDPDVQALLPKMRRKDLDEMSFSFRVKDQDWDSNYTKRSINELSLQKGDVSVVNYGMNPNTNMSIVDEIGAFAALSLDQLAEVRGLDAKKVDRAIINLAQLKPAQSISVRMDGGGGGESRKIGDPRPTTPLVPYADPGYRSDGKKRYPIDTEPHARSAWQYINMPENQSGYTEAQVAGIRNRVAGALRKFGVDVAPLDQPYTKEVEVAEETIVAPSTVPASPGLDMHTSERGYDPETGEVRASGHPEDCDCAACAEGRADDGSKTKTADDEEKSTRDDSALAAALDATITHAYALAEGNEPVRAVLRDAQSQLNAMRGLEGDGGAVGRQLAELRKEMGMPDVISLAEGEDFIKRMGTASLSLHRVADLETT
jgi:HK97 family phage prohead protease